MAVAAGMLGATVLARVGVVTTQRGCEGGTEPGGGGGQGVAGSDGAGSGRVAGVDSRVRARRWAWTTTFAHLPLRKNGTIPTTTCNTHTDQGYISLDQSR